MFGPYRTPPEVREKPPPLDEIIVIARGLLVLGGVRVIVAIVLGEPWGFEPALAAIMGAGGLTLLLRRRRGRLRA